MIISKASQNSEPWSANTHIVSLSYEEKCNPIYEAREEKKNEYETTSTTNIDTTHQTKPMKYFKSILVIIIIKLQTSFAMVEFVEWNTKEKHTTKHSNLIGYALNHLYFVYFIFRIFQERNSNRCAAILCSWAWAVHAVQYEYLCVLFNSTRTALMSGSTEPIHV